LFRRPKLALSCSAEGKGICICMYTHIVIKTHNINFRENPSVVLEFLIAERGAGVYRRGAAIEPIFCNIFLRKSRKLLSLEGTEPRSL
jgi:hypothetical protein